MTLLDELKRQIERLHVDGQDHSYVDEYKEAMHVRRKVIYKGIHDKINDFIKNDMQLHSAVSGLGYFNMYTFINPILGMGDQIETKAMEKQITLDQINNSNYEDLNKLLNISIFKPDDSNLNSINRNLLNTVFNLYITYILDTNKKEAAEEAAEAAEEQMNKQEEKIDDLTDALSLKLEKLMSEGDKQDEINELKLKYQQKISMIGQYGEIINLETFNNKDIKQDDEAFKTMLEEISTAFEDASKKLGQRSDPNIEWLGGRKHKSRRRRRRKSGKKSRKSRRKSKKSRKTRRRKSKKSRKTRRRRR